MTCCAHVSEPSLRIANLPFAGTHEINPITINLDPDLTVSNWHEMGF